MSHPWLSLCISCQYLAPKLAAACKVSEMPGCTCTGPELCVLAASAVQDCALPPASAAAL